MSNSKIKSFCLTLEQRIKQRIGDYLGDMELVCHLTEGTQYENYTHSSAEKGGWGSDPAMDGEISAYVTEKLVDFVLDEIDDQLKDF